MVGRKEGGNKILFVRTDPCVLDPRVLKESSSLHACGYQIRVFGWDRKNQFPKYETLHGVQYARSRIPGPYGSKMLAFVMPLFWLRVAWEITVYRPDAVHACDFDAYVPALLMKAIFRHAIIYDIFDNFSEKIIGLPRIVRASLHTVDCWLMRFAEGVIVTDNHRKGLIEGVPIRCLTVIMNVPPKRMQLVKTRSQRNFQLCYAGVIHEHRGLLLIADAVRQLDGVEAVFAGWIPRLRDAEFLKNQERLQYIGKLSYEESLGLMAESDVILALYDPSLPINALASSNKIFEAMAVQRPVITNAETTMARIVAEEDCGCILPYGDSNALRNVIIQLRDDKEFRNTLGAHGFKAFVSKYNWEIMEQRLVNLYESILRPSKVQSGMQGVDW